MPLPLPPDVLAQLPEVLRPFNVGLLYLYGSTFHGTADEQSDVDLAAYLAEPDADRRWSRLQLLRRALNDHFRLPAIQVADLRHGDPGFLLDVIQGECLFAQSPDLQLTFETRVMREAGEKPHLGDERWQALKERFQAGFLTARPALHRDKLQRLLTALEHQTRELQPYAALDLATFLSADYYIRRLACAHLLRTNLETILAIARHLVVAHGWTRSAKPRDLLATLAAKGVVPAETADEIGLICLLRDPLTYPEDGLDFELVGRVVQENLPLFEAFGRAIVTYLDRLGY